MEREESSLDSEVVVSYKVTGGVCWYLVWNDGGGGGWLDEGMGKGKERDENNMRRSLA